MLPRGEVLRFIWRKAKMLKGSWRFWLLSLSVVGNLSSANALDLYPSNIEVRLGQVGDSFYSVVMDDYENPYPAR